MLPYPGPNVEVILFNPERANIRDKAGFTGIKFQIDRMMLFQLKTSAF